MLYPNYEIPSCYTHAHSTVPSSVFRTGVRPDVEKNALQTRPKYALPCTLNIILRITYAVLITYSSVFFFRIFVET